MTSRGRNQQSQEWDMADANDSMYDPQYPDDDVRGGVQLDHCKLYVRNIPKSLNEEGLRRVFEAYGSLNKVFLSRDPDKRYALVWYQTASEASLAIMKLNGTEPLGLDIKIAHKDKKNYDSQQSQPRERRSNNNHVKEAGGLSYRNDNSSESSRGRHSQKQDDYSNGMNELSVQDDDDDNLDLEVGTTLTMEAYKEYLKMHEKRLLCKQKLLLISSQAASGTRDTGFNSALTSRGSSNRCILPDGRVVVRNVVNERAVDQSDDAFNSAVGDSSLPPLQRAQCVSCGAPTDVLCARCGMTPYCGVACQQRDWKLRHSAVCHNLARQNKKAAADMKEKEMEPAASHAAPAPLRRPRSPAPKRDFNNENYDRPPKKNLLPAGNTNFQQSNNTQNKTRGGAANRTYTNNQTSRPRQNDAFAADDEDSLEPRVDPKAATGPTTKPAQMNPPAPKQVQTPPSAPKQVQTPPPAPKQVQTPPPAPKQVQIPPPASKQVEPTPKPVQKTAPKPVSEFLQRSSPMHRGSGATCVATVPEVNATKPVNEKPTLPKSYLIETRSIGDTLLLSVDAKASECKSNSAGFVCMSLHEDSQQQFQLLCEDFTVDSEAMPDCKPNPGDLFSYYNPDDGAYYRARCLTPTSAALVDSSKVVALGAADKCKKLAPKYEEIAEFCCVLDAAGVKIGDSVKITLKAKTGEGYKVVVVDSETDAPVGEGEVSRWRPLVEHPPKPAPVAVVIPEVPRPALKNNATVLLVDASSLQQHGKLMVRPADTESTRKFDAVLHDVVQFSMTASPIKESPQKGQVVIGKFTDGMCYRALCQRTSEKLNKYLLEYIEFGNVEKTTKEQIYACPQNLDLNSAPTVVSAVRLQLGSAALTAAAVEYLQTLSDDGVELLLTLPDGAASAPSGAEVCLAIAKNRESVNKKLELMCTPDWKKMENNGGDVLDLKPLMLNDMEYQTLPSGECELEILDASLLGSGTLSGCEAGPKYAEQVARLEALTKRMEEYCNSELGKLPYLPACEELCIAKSPTDGQWYRAVVCEQVGGPGGSDVRVLYVDYGNLEVVPVDALRKMLPEFVRGHPAVAATLDITGWPAPCSQEQLSRAAAYLAAGARSVLHVARCTQTSVGFYRVDAPKLLRAMGIEH